MKMFTDVFIKRPVLATVVSLLILLFGLQSIQKLTLRQFPKLENTVITVTTIYPGASAQLMEGFITSPLQKSIASAEGIDYLTAESTQGISVIQAHIKLNEDPNVAFTEVMSKAAEVRAQLPKESEDPVVKKDTGSQIASMYISFSSDKMSAEQITDYISRVVQPKLETIDGVAQAQILGDKTFAMRIWLNPDKMAALGVTPTEVSQALQANNFQSAAGKTKGEWVAFSINAKTDIESSDAFENLVVKEANNNQLIRLRDLAKIELGSENYDASVIFNGKQAVFIGITTTPSANPLTVIKKVRETLPVLQKSFPSALKTNIVYDATTYIDESINEVIQTMIEATIIVVLVIFLFLGSFRAILIPVVTIPLSLIGVTTFMLILGYSINLLTLLAMVLSIGLVVDDAIVVLENIHRHIEEGLQPFKAAIQGTREIALPVISMTITLAAVYAPIGFMDGLTGALFKEFAFTLASAVIISGVIALTLSPMMCSKLLSNASMQGKFATTVDARFEKLHHFYQRCLHRVIDARPVVLLFAGVILTSCFLLYLYTPKQLAPDEDQSVLFISSTAPEYANINYVEKFTKQFEEVYKAFPERQDYFVINGMGSVNNVISGLILKPWGQRKRSQEKLQPMVQGKLQEIAGLNTVVFPLPSLPTGSSGLPIEFVITSTTDYPLIFDVANQLKDVAQKSGLFIFLDSSLKFNRPQLDITIDRNKAAILGISMQSIGAALSNTFGGGSVNRFSMSGKSYEVIPQLLQKYRYNPEQIKDIFIKTGSGDLVPLSTVVNVKSVTEPNKLTQFQQLNSTSLQGVMMPGVTVGEALAYLKNKADEILPKEMSYDYGGDSRQFIQEGSSLVYTFFFALLVIFLVLAAQFESFRDPLIILISVPMSVCGALIPLNLGLATINIYTQVGLITLIGLISKHGILMVEFANKLQQNEGLSIRDAIEKAAGIRLRAILMTTGATILGVTPLLFANGAGAKSRFSIGLVITMGMLIGTLFTLFVVPTIYIFLAKKHQLIEE